MILSFSQTSHSNFWWTKDQNLRFSVTHLQSFEDQKQGSKSKRNSTSPWSISYLFIYFYVCGCGNGIRFFERFWNFSDALGALGRRWITLEETSIFGFLITWKQETHKQRRAHPPTPKAAWHGGDHKTAHNSAAHKTTSSYPARLRLTRKSCGSFVRLIIKNLNLKNVLLRWLSPNSLLLS